MLTPLADAPGFTLPTLDGKLVSLSGLQGQGPVVLLFFEAECPTCEFALPYLQRLAARLPDAGDRMIGIAQNTAGEAGPFCESLGVRVTVALDTEPFPVSKAYGLMTVPTLFLVEPDGHLGLRSEGFARHDWESVEQRLTPSGRTLDLPLFDDSVPAFRPGCAARRRL